MHVGTAQVEQPECDSPHLHEREDEAHGEVGHPVKGTSDDVGCWAVGLFEQLRGYQERDPRCEAHVAVIPEQTGWIKQPNTTDLTLSAASHPAVMLTNQVYVAYWRHDSLCCLIKPEIYFPCMQSISRESNAGLA